jgi:bacillithiol biosynthesis deacetylase BshB1
LVINSNESRCDLLVISPHTDDAEIALGGTLRLLANQGRKVWVADLTRGEIATNATVDERWQEAFEASKILGLAGRLQLELPDGFVDRTDQHHVGQVVALLRRLCPRWVVTAPNPARHPDHIETPGLVEKALFMARLRGWQPELAAHHLWPGGEALPAAVDRWAVASNGAVCGEGDRPDLIFDVSTTWSAKMAAIDCYQSQLQRQSQRTATMINDPSFLDKIERRAKALGWDSGVELAEAITVVQCPVVDDLPTESWTG